VLTDMAYLFDRIEPLEISPLIHIRVNRGDNIGHFPRVAISMY
jgi:hypothetical protein